MVQVGDVEKFPQVLDHNTLNPFSRERRWGPCLLAMEEDGGDKRLVQPEFTSEADAFTLPDPV